MTMATAVRPLRALYAVGALCVLCGSVVKKLGLVTFYCRGGRTPWETLW